VTQTARELWERLAAAGFVAGGMPAAGAPASPWYVRVMLGAAGWIAALFLLGFIAVGLRLNTSGAAIAVGMVAIGIAFVVLRIATRNDFAGQFGVAVSFAGQALVLFGLWELVHRNSAGLWLAVAALQAGLAVLIPNYVHRVWSGWAAVTALALALIKLREPYIAPALAGVAVAALWLTELRWGRLAAMLRPVAYGVTLALVMLETHPFFAKWWLGLYTGGGRGKNPLIEPWVNEVAAGLLLVVVVWRLLAQADRRLDRRDALIALATAAAVGVLAVEAPGIATGLMLALLAYSAGNRVLLGIALAALAFYLSAYYYMLEETLLFKSAVLAATGLILLAARWLMLRFVLPETGNDAA
jgi:uncharacterized membrane protein